MRNQDLNDRWMFLRGDVPGAEASSFDDLRWQRVDLPHTWSAQDAIGGRHDYYRGPSWYRRHFALDASALQHRQTYLWFGAAGSAAEVFVNGASAGTHRGGFAAFCFDVTRLLTPGDNVIAVRVTNAFDRHISPINGDFNICGGLYRGAQLLQLPKTSISPLDDGSSGVYVTQKQVSDRSAEIVIATRLRNARTTPQTVHVACWILDAQRACLGHATVRAEMAGSSEQLVAQTITINRPRLWNGRKDPYLYEAVVEVTDPAGETDRVTMPIGLRSLRIDPHQGFVLNDEQYDLHGVNRHQDFGAKSWAITPREMETDIRMIKEMGCTMIRLPHYQHAAEFHNLCDRNGLVVWSELGLVNEIDPSPEFAEVTKQQLRELIKQNYNHPSICVWGLFNELWFKDRVEEQLNLVRELNDLAHELDATRPTTAATHLSVEHPANWISVVVAFNRYDGWYVAAPDNWPRMLDSMQVNTLNGRAIGISEYGAGASILHHEVNPKQPATTARWHPEEWQCIVHEHAWNAMRTWRDLWCKLIWVFADFPVASRAEGDRIGMNDKGMVTFDRSVKKDAFYFYKANWSDEPFVHITSKRFTPRPMTATPVKVYSNCDVIELRVNGERVGEQRSDDRIFVFENVELRPGENHLEARGRRGGKTFIDKCVIVQDSTATTKLSR